MKIEEIVGRALGLFDKESEAVRLELDKAARRAVDEKTRDAAENAQKHPVQSSTPLKESLHRSYAAVARLEQKHASVIREALSGVAAIAIAREYVAHIEKAIERDNDVKREKGEAGLYAAARKAIDKMYARGAGKWHWGQVADPEIEFFADAVRWKAENPAHDDPNSPWPDINAIYKERLIPRDMIGKVGLSLPKKPRSGRLQVQPTSPIPTVAEMKDIAGDWARYDPAGIARRTEGIGRLETDDPYGAFLSRKTPERAAAMRDREELYEDPSDRLGANHWSRFDVPRSAYAVVENGTRFDFPDLPQLYPPLAKLKLLGVTLDYSFDKLRELEEAEAGEADPAIIFETVRAAFLKHNNCHDEDLIRFWLFLLVGRKYPDRVDALFPPGYFHGVRGPDVWGSRDSPTHFQIVRVAADRDYRHMMRHPDFGPWEALR